MGRAEAAAKELAAQRDDAKSEVVERNMVAMTVMVVTAGR